MPDLIALLLVAHACGDFILQNDEMQEKSRSSPICALHVLYYSAPFTYLGCVLGILPLWAFSAILVQHYLQDRYALHLRWMKWFKQTPPARWPSGPLFVDQAWHITWLGIIGLIVEFTT